MQALRGGGQAPHPRGRRHRLVDDLLPGLRLCRQPLAINAATLAGIRHNVARFAELKYADSFTVDFQKWGYVALHLQPGDDQGPERPQGDGGTIRRTSPTSSATSRATPPAVHHRGAPAGRAACSVPTRPSTTWGRGIAPCWPTACKTPTSSRFRLSQLSSVSWWPRRTRGPGVGFADLQPRVGAGSGARFAFRLAWSRPAPTRRGWHATPEYHRSPLQGRGKVGLYTNWVEAVARSDYDARGHLLLSPGKRRYSRTRLAAASRSTPLSTTFAAEDRPGADKQTTNGGFSRRFLTPVCGYCFCSFVTVSFQQPDFQRGSSPHRP